MRGSFGSAFQHFVSVGVVGSMILNFLVLGFGSPWALSRGFLLCFATPALAGALQAVTVWKLSPESPKWLLKMGRRSAARAALQRVRWNTSFEELDAELHAMEGNEGNEDETVEAAATGTATTPAGKAVTKVTKACSAESAKTTLAEWCALFSPRYRRPVMIAFVICWFQVAIPIDAMTQFNVPIFLKMGFTPTAANATTVLVALALLIAVLPALCLVEIVGRKTLLLCGSVGNILSIGGAAAVIALYAVWPSPFLTVVGAICCVVWVSTFSLSWGPIAWVVPPEILPATVRSKALTLCVLGNWLADWFVVITFQPISSMIGYAGTLAMYTGVAFLALIFVTCCVKETKGIDLEEMEKDVLMFCFILLSLLFSNASHSLSLLLIV